MSSPANDALVKNFDANIANIVNYETNMHLVLILACHRFVRDSFVHHNDLSIEARNLYPTFWQLH